MTVYIKIIIQIIFIKTITQISKHDTKYIITACIPIIIIKIFLLFYLKKNYNYIKKVSSPHNYKKKFCLLNIRMVNQGLHLSLNELRLIAEHRNISDYAAKDLIKTLTGSRPRL